MRPKSGTPKPQSGLVVGNTWPLPRKHHSVGLSHVAGPCGSGHGSIAHRDDENQLQWLPFSA